MNLGNVSTLLIAGQPFTKQKLKSWFLDEMAFEFPFNNNDVFLSNRTYIAGPYVQALIQTYPNLQLFFNYIDNTYINGGIFDIRFWNVHNRRMDTRTNNYVEGKMLYI